MSTNEQRRMAQSLSKVYRQQGMSQSEAQKKAWQDLKNNTVATKDLAKATEDVAEKTEQATKETKEYGDAAKRSGTVAKKAFLAVGKAFLAIGVASATATIAMTKQAVSAYADYEQLVGGVETLFKCSAQKVVDYANDAFYTAGVSANEYMQQVTSFSASLIRSTAGDTDKAADIANMALQDISDNVNKMGSSMESVTLAYQGFAKQQYQLLDNLKLGYGGTKGEMERLLKDAQALTGVKYDINNLADVYSAVHAIQEELGITGTTAKEAEKTITGSANMMKAAWQNVLSAIAGGGDLDKAINNLVYSVQKYFENIVPVVERSLQGIGQLIAKIAPMLVQTVARSLIKAIPELVNSVYEMIIGLGKGIYQGFVDLFSGGVQKNLEKQTNESKNSAKNQNKLTNNLKETNKELKKSLAGFDEIQVLTSTTTEQMEDVADMTANGALTSEIFPSMGGTGETEGVLGGFVQRMLTLLEPLTTSLSNLFEPMKESAYKVKQELNPFMEWISTKFAPTLVNGLAKGVDSVRVSFENIREPIENLWHNTLKPIIEDIGQWILDIINSTSESFDYFGEKMAEYKDEIALVVEGIGEILSVIWSVLGPIISSVVDGIWPVLKTTIDFIFSIISTIGNVFGFLKNIFLSIKNLFTGNLDEAKNYAKQALANFVNIFVGIGNAIISVINNLWTLIFDAFKGTVNSIGGLVEKIGSWLGFDWNLQWEANAPLIPLIPKYVPALATGAVLPPNKPFMAMVGDQKHGTNIEAPLDTIVEAMNIALQNNGAGQTTKEEHYYLNETELMSVVYRLVKGGERLKGNSLVTGGAY
jgi:phage-related protein